MSHVKKLEALYAKIPDFKCIEGCTDCCGPVPVSITEIVRMAETGHAGALKAQRTRLDKDTFLADGRGGCPAAVEGKGCGIYDHRPFICRLFGTVETGHTGTLLACPHGKGPAIKFTEAEAAALTDEYEQIAALHTLALHREKGAK